MGLARDVCGKARCICLSQHLFVKQKDLLAVVWRALGACGLSTWPRHCWSNRARQIGRAAASGAGGVPAGASPRLPLYYPTLKLNTIASNQTQIK